MHSIRVIFFYTDDPVLQEKLYLTVCLQRPNPGVLGKVDNQPSTSTLIASTETIKPRQNILLELLLSVAAPEAGTMASTSAIINTTFVLCTIIQCCRKKPYFTVWLRRPNPGVLGMVNDCTDSINGNHNLDRTSHSNYSSASQHPKPGPWRPHPPSSTLLSSYVLLIPRVDGSMSLECLTVMFH
ncbi:uncharacterized protein [Periplaneta americana]|uniref:uncharacterized protein n=1 Tax=Periplaneta americana TaxID=6978 RepID=UPI0037E746CF